MASMSRMVVFTSVSSLTVSTSPSRTSQSLLDLMPGLQDQILAHRLSLLQEQYPSLAPPILPCLEITHWQALGYMRLIYLRTASMSVLLTRIPRGVSASPRMTLIRTTFFSSLLRRTTHVVDVPNNYDQIIVGSSPHPDDNESTDRAQMTDNIPPTSPVNVSVVAADGSKFIENWESCDA